MQIHTALEVEPLRQMLLFIIMKRDFIIIIEFHYQEEILQLQQNQVFGTQLRLTRLRQLFCCRPPLQ